MKNNNNISLYKSPITNRKPFKTVSIVEIYELIKSENYKSVIETLRSTKTKKARNQIKTNQLDFVTFSGRFSERKASGLIEHSDLIVIDLDDLKNVEKTKASLINDSTIPTELLFKSPSGNGLKWVLSIDSSEYTNGHYLCAVANYLNYTYGIKVDTSGKDVSRACFLSHDKEAYLNPKYFNQDESISNSFNPEPWLDKALSRDEDVPKHSGLKSIDNSKTISRLIELVERDEIDLTSIYDDWVQIGFALSSEFGEFGRPYFHKLSQFHSDYNKRDCDSQYDKCLNSKGSGIGLGTLLYKAEKAGIDLKTKNDTREGDRFPKSVYHNLPPFIDDAIKLARTSEERDIILLGSLVTLGSGLSNVKGIYNSQPIYPNLYLFVSAIASAGKGGLAFAKDLIWPLHKFKGGRPQKTNAAFARGNTDSIQPPVDRPNVHIIPGNNSSTGMCQMLADNDGVGLIFETEADTLSQALKSEHGNFSDSLRKAFHHEQISYNRRINNEFRSIDLPKLSLVLSGTPNQINRLFQSSENGLFSRFLFYRMPSDIAFRNVFANVTGIDLHSKYLDIGERFLVYLKAMLKVPSIRFTYSNAQSEKFVSFFQEMTNKYTLKQGTNFVSIVRRMAVSTFRISMILTSLRNKPACPDRVIVCSDIDFNRSLDMARVLLRHSELMYEELPGSTSSSLLPELQEELLTSLPKQFTSSDYTKAVSEKNLNQRTAERWLSKYADMGLVRRLRKGLYKKQL